MACKQRQGLSRVEAPQRTCVVACAQQQGEHGGPLPLAGDGAQALERRRMPPRRAQRLQQRRVRNHAHRHLLLPHAVHQAPRLLRISVQRTRPQCCVVQRCPVGGAPGRGARGAACRCVGCRRSRRLALPQQAQHLAEIAGAQGHLHCLLHRLCCCPLGRQAAWLLLLLLQVLLLCRRLGGGGGSGSGGRWALLPYDRISAHRRAAECVEQRLPWLGQPCGPASSSQARGLQPAPHCCLHRALGRPDSGVGYGLARLWVPAFRSLCNGHAWSVQAAS